MRWFLLFAACELISGRVRHPDDEDTDPTPFDTDDTVEDTDTGDPLAACPVEMSLIDGTFCVDKWEASTEELVGESWVPSSPYETARNRTLRAVSAPGKVPQGYLSAREAAAACEASGKRLCSNAEWLASCRSPDARTWPYGDTYNAVACNDHYAGEHPVIDFFGTAEGVWDVAHMNDPGINQQTGTVSPTGQFAGCVSAGGVFDLHGNLHEWTDDPEGTFRGGFYADGDINGDGCNYVTTAHADTYHDYSTGFRCCMDPRQ